MPYHGQEYALPPSEILYLRGGEPSEARPCDCYYEDNVLVVCALCKEESTRLEKEANKAWIDMLTDIGGEA